MLLLISPALAFFDVSGLVNFRAIQTGNCKEPRHEIAPSKSQLTVAPGTANFYRKFTNPAPKPIVNEIISPALPGNINEMSNTIVLLGRILED